MRLNENIDTTVLTITPYGMARQLEEVYSESINGNWFAETALQHIAHSTLTQIRTEYGVYAALDYLNQKLETVRKTISFWDAYQIYGTTQQSSLSTQLTQLPANSSLVNKDLLPFLWTDPQGESHTVYTGDIFIKDYNGNVSLIAATNKGVFVPVSMQVVSGNTYKIIYDYKTNSFPDKVPLQATIDTSTNDSAYNERNYVEAGEDVTFSSVYKTFGDASSRIVPIIKTFTAEEHELVLNATTLSLSGSASATASYWTLHNNSVLRLWYEVR